MGGSEADSALSRRFPLVIVANTLPVRRAQRKGKTVWHTSPGGLVSALAPFTREARGAWIGWVGDSKSVPQPFEHDGVMNIPVRVSASEQEGSYEGVCNSTFWPLYHDAVREPEYHRHWWRKHVTVNQRFAERAAQVTASKGVVWIQDYHLQLVPAMLRKRRPDLRIGFFLHIPFPPEELFVRLPWRTQTLRGLLGADVVGFQTAAGARNFIRLAQRFTEASGRGNRLHLDNRSITVQAFPISIDFERYDGTARNPVILERAAQIRARLGAQRTIVLGVDRLDYTKGIDLRLKAFQQVLDASKGASPRAVLVQVAVPSRERLADYQDLRAAVEGLVGKINGQHGEVGVAAVHYLRRNLPFEELVAMYRAADVMMVTPLADGMNLVAKEYVATRFDNSGTLILSEFAGAADELKSALHVNPHDVDAMAEKIQHALDMPEREIARRMRSMRRVVKKNTVHDWAEAFLNALRRPRRASGRRGAPVSRPH